MTVCADDWAAERAIIASNDIVLFVQRNFNKGMH